ncbi:hypothetical protein PG994_007004 [Apiospora phragmitis]|uniref:Uncharacterized protein n=1 Tax=Apiospora phragmitis TaxID=2905665 RepID=A0ABR1UZH9_9PEZI
MRMKSDHGRCSSCNSPHAETDFREPLGYDQADALESIFNVPHEFGHLLGHLIHLRDLFAGNEVIAQ